MENKWICTFKDFELPLIVDSKEEVIEYFTNCNNSRCEGEGVISDIIEDDYTLADDTDITTKKIILTVGSYDEDDPMGVAYLYDYGQKLITSVQNKKPDASVKTVNCYNPLFGENQKYSKIYHSLRVCTNNSPHAIATNSPPSINLTIKIINQTPNRDIKITSQDDIIDWLYNNIEIIHKEYNNVEGIDDIMSSIPIIINGVSNQIAACTRRGPGNRIIVGNVVYENIKNLIKDKSNSILEHYSSPDYEFKGYLNNCIEVYVPRDKDLISENAVLMSYSSNALDTGAYLLKDKDAYYLNPMKSDPSIGSFNEYKDFFRIIEFTKQQ